MTFEEVYEEHFRYVWRALRGLGVSEADTPDAAQEVFLVVHRKLADFEGRARVTTWLFGICLRIASERRRRAPQRREVSGDNVVGDLVDLGADSAAAAERNEGVALLEAVLDALPLEQRTVFLLFELEGMSGTEVADTLCVPLATVHSRLRLAREAIRQQMSRREARERFPFARGGRTS